MGVNEGSTLDNQVCCDACSLVMDSQHSKHCAVCEASPDPVARYFCDGCVVKCPVCGEPTCESHMEYEPLALIPTPKACSTCDNYDGPGDGEAWSGGFAENH